MEKVKFLIFESEDKIKEILSNDKPCLIKAGNREICLVHKNDRLFAFQNSCTHMGTELHQGNTNFLNEIICPLHFFRFSMETGEESQQRCRALKTYRIIYSSEGIFIEID